jgi:hypothetical protein
MIMKTIKFQLIFVALLVLATGVSAQNPYADIEKDSYADVLKFAGQKPSITDFATYCIGEPTPPEEDDGLECGWGCDFRDVWSKYRKHKPLTTTEEWTEKVTVDAKNGYACIELYFAVKDQDYKRDAKMEMCYWNCSDGKHKVFAVSESCSENGKLMGLGGFFGGFGLYLYNNDTHKIYRCSASELGAEVKTGYEHISQDHNDDEYFRIDNNTGVRTKITKKEWEDWTWPFVIYTLPRVGKDINAVIYDLPGGETKKILVKWNGLTFDVQK